MYSPFSNWFPKIKIPIFVPTAPLCVELYTQLYTALLASQRADLTERWCVFALHVRPMWGPFHPPLENKLVPTWGLWHQILQPEQWLENDKTLDFWLVLVSCWALHFALWTQTPFFTSAKGGVVEKCRSEFVQCPFCTGWPFSNATKLALTNKADLVLNVYLKFLWH